MRTLYLDCGMGAAGDMLAAALLELVPEPDKLIQELNGLGIPGVRYERKRSVKCGITGIHLSVAVNGMEEESCDYDDVQQEHICEHDHSHSHSDEHEHNHDHSHSNSDEHEHKHDHSHSDEHEHNHNHSHSHGHDHHHSSLHDIEHIVRGHLALPRKVQDDIMAVYTLIAEAESHVHGVPVQEIHFHEVGTMDAVADITAVCILMNRLAPEEVMASPIHVGSGQVRCAHGILPVPAPATARILEDVPIYGGAVRGELCTPTGAALLKYFVTQFGDMPVMKTKAVGYGMGKKDFEAANCVRAFLGESQERAEQVLELSCNVDDMTAEAVGFAVERLFEGGAKDVYTIPIGMKKSRPGILIRVMCTELDRQKMLELLFKYTTTIGIRETETKRYILDRRITALETPYGKVHRKDSAGYGVSRSKYEYEDIARIARQQGLSLEEVCSTLEDFQ